MFEMCRSFGYMISRFFCRMNAPGINITHCVLKAMPVYCHTPAAVQFLVFFYSLLSTEYLQHVLKTTCVNKNGVMLCY